MYEILVNISKGGGYFPLSVLAYVFGVFFFDFLFKGKDFILASKNIRIALSVELVTGILLTWGLDVLQRQYEVETMKHALMVSFGVYLLLVLPIELRHHLKSTFSLNGFWLDVRKYLAGYFLCSLSVYYFS